MRGRGRRRWGIVEYGGHCAGGSALGIEIALDALEFSTHLRGVLEAEVAVFLECARDDVVEAGGRFGFKRTAGTGSCSRIALKITAGVSP